MDPRLVRRLRSAGIVAEAISDPAAAFAALCAAEGERATIVDRYALEAAHSGIEPGALPQEARGRLAAEVLRVRYPELELVGSPGGDPVIVVPYDDRWPVAFSTWRDRLAASLGTAAIRIEHIGSTAVPGLAAKPVVDVQVSVPDVTDEASYRPAIEACGVPLRAREPDHRYFRPPRGRRRVVQIHVCSPGGRQERVHLLFRDYLREHSEVAAAYGRLKQRLAQAYGDDRLAYTDAKTDFILSALDDAGGWAERTGWSVPPPRPVAPA